MTEILQSVPDPKPTVFEALNSVMGDLRAVGKDRVNDQQHFKFRGIDQAMNAAHPLFAKHGVLMVPTVLERIGEDRATKSGSAMNVVHLRIRYRFYGPSGDFIDSEVWGEASDLADKATNKAMAAAMKYALFQTLCIPTEDQPDADQTTVEASRASDPATLAELNQAVDDAGNKDALRRVYGRIKVALSARKITDVDAANLGAACADRAGVIDAENAADQHEQDNADDAAVLL